MKTKSIKALGRRTQTGNMKHNDCPCTKKRVPAKKGGKK